eukprot:gene27753-34265_t
MSFPEGGEGWSWENLFPFVFQPNAYDAIEGEEHTLARLHLNGYFTFHLRLPSTSSSRSVKMLCVCCFPRSLEEDSFVGEHLKQEDVERLLAADGERTIALYVHGNAESVHSCFVARNFVNRHLSAVYLSFEWQGYGTNMASSPRFDAQSERCLALLRLLLKRGKAKPRNPVLLVGYSLGCAVLLDAIRKERTACDARIAGLRAPIGTLLLAPFLSAASLIVSPPVVTDVVTHLFPPMNNADAVMYLRTDVLVVHGAKDEIIPARHSSRLVRSFRSAVANRSHRSDTLLVPEATHTNLLLGPNISYVSSVVRKFFRMQKR